MPPASPPSPTACLTAYLTNPAGNNPCYPYDACAATHLGDDLDVVTWEQSMNCGRDAKPLESFSRAVAAMPKVHFRTSPACCALPSSVTPVLSLASGADGDVLRQRHAALDAGGLQEHHQ